jgi:hypothetical protein
VNKFESHLPFDRLSRVLESWKFEIPPPTREKEAPEELLYHYTTPEGFLGILKSESIRATHVRCLNDRTELKNALGNL